MGDHNSLEVYTSLLLQLLHDIAQCYDDESEFKRDEQEIVHRSFHEGFSFLTITLPRYGKAIDMALHSELPLCITGLATQKNSVVPKFLGVLLGRVFDSLGYVRNNPDISALKQVRQLVYFLYKLEIPYPPATIKKVVDGFVQTEMELKQLSINPSEPVIKRARVFLSQLFSGFDVRDIIPKHGPGAVSTGEAIGQKSNFSRLYTKLDEVFPFTEYFTMGSTHIVDQFDWIQSLEVLDTATAKAVLVPKDSRGPRFISCEPLELQWIQQGIQRKLYTWVEEHPMSRGHVNFTDQSINQKLALLGSSTTQWVTLDMKDASDRVSTELVKHLFSGTPILDALLASRSNATRLPDGCVVSLAKFAPMGSAVCFPIEALCFWALASSLLYTKWRSKTTARVSRAKSLDSVYVYGDDIIVKREDYALLMQYFPKVGLMFNSSKCCVGGFFRESCGVDAFKGVNVTPTRMSKVWRHHANKLDAAELSSYCALSNALWEKGYWTTSEAIRKLVESRYGKLPYLESWDVSPPKGDVFNPLTLHFGQKCPRRSGLVGFYRSHVNPVSENIRRRLPWRYNHGLQRLEFRGYTIKPTKKTWKVDGWKEMLRVLNTGSSGSTNGTYALPRRSSLKREWKPL